MSEQAISKSKKTKRYFAAKGAQLSTVVKVVFRKKVEILSWSAKCIKHIKIIKYFQPNGKQKNYYAQDKEAV